MKMMVIRLVHTAFSKIVSHPTTVLSWLSKLLVALSPLIALGYILFTAFESPEQEALKRKKKGDFDLDGHAE